MDIERTKTAIRRSIASLLRAMTSKELYLVHAKKVEAEIDHFLEWAQDPDAMGDAPTSCLAYCYGLWDSFFDPQNRSECMEVAEMGPMLKFDAALRRIRWQGDLAQLDDAEFAATAECALLADLAQRCSTTFRAFPDLHLFKCYYIRDSRVLSDGSIQMNVVGNAMGGHWRSEYFVAPGSDEFTFWQWLRRRWFLPKILLADDAAKYYRRFSRRYAA
ncbi:MAG: hypothetical protein WD768_14750 [Phycisphaeraceae bacterium]